MIECNLKCSLEVTKEGLKEISKSIEKLIKEDWNGVVLNYEIDEKQLIGIKVIFPFNKGNSKI
jgi:hypothetical protein